MGWMKKVFVSRSLDSLKKHKSELFMDNWEREEDFYQIHAGHDNTPELHYLDDEKVALFNEFIDRLPEKQALTIRLIYMDELSISDAAKILNVPDCTVKSRLNTARKRLEEIISSYEKKSKVKLFSAIPLPLLLLEIDKWRFTKSIGQGVKEHMWSDVAKYLE